MEFGIKNVKFSVMKDGHILSTHICPSFLLNTLTDIYCDFKESPYTLRVSFEDGEIDIKSPEDFNYGNVEVIERFVKEHIENEK